ncbi:hypothetical protein [Streptomyces sp. NPDC014623]|uniref:hypothetical protein n=1 Tax=Streptomyces sp. NPDC014623 TaxID=3364875 RepID=UPI0036FF9880
MVTSVRTGLRAAVPAVVPGAFLVGCGAAATTGGPGGDVPDVDPPVAAAAEAKADEVPLMPAPSPTPTLVIQADPDAPELVRAAFAGLQATLDGNCTPGDGNCAYFLGRVLPGPGRRRAEPSGRGEEGRQEGARPLRGAHRLDRHPAYDAGR